MVPRLSGCTTHTAIDAPGSGSSLSKPWVIGSRDIGVNESCRSELSKALARAGEHHRRGDAEGERAAACDDILDRFADRAAGRAPACSPR